MFPHLMFISNFGDRRGGCVYDGLLCVVRGHSRLLEGVGLTQAPQLRLYSSGILILLTLEWVNSGH